MPELPEVETVRRCLLKSVLDNKIVEITSNYPEMVEGDFDDFKNNLIGHRIINIDRKGKYLIFKLDNINLISHLRMEGKFFYQQKNEPVNKHIHMIIRFENDYELRYQDTRKFGRMVLKDNDALFTTPPLSNLGADANDETIDVNDFINKLQKRKNTIKEALLNQEIISGLGNIYVDEVLALSHISPLRKANSIDLEEAKLILSSAKEILDKAIIYKGTTIRTYTSSLGVKGEFQEFLLVHTKTICPYCNAPISKSKIGGRTSYYCTKCQG